MATAVKVQSKAYVVAQHVREDMCVFGRIPTFSPSTEMVLYMMGFSMWMMNGGEH